MKRGNLILKSLILITVMGLFLIAGCKKDDSDTTNTTAADDQSAYDNEMSERVSNEVLNIAYSAINNQNQYKDNKESNDLLNKSCAELTLTNEGTYFKLIVNFGNTNCTGIDGRQRKGKIIITFKGKYFHEGFTDTVRFDNHYINNHHVEGTHIVTNEGFNTNNNMHWSIKAIDMKITNPAGTSWHTWNSERDRELLVIKDTVSYDKIAYSITGEANGTNQKGKTYTVEITNPLVHSLGCWWIEKGTIVINKGNKPEITLDYGDGSCNNKATVTVNGKTYEITL